MKAKPSDAKDILDLLMGAKKPQGDDPKSDKKPLDAIAILTLPSNLRKTAVAIHRVVRATAKMISEYTGQDKKVEYANLKQLEAMGYLQVKKNTNVVFFEIVT